MGLGMNVSHLLLQLAVAAANYLQEYTEEQWGLNSSLCPSRANKVKIENTQDSTNYKCIYMLIQVMYLGIYDKEGGWLLLLREVLIKHLSGVVPPRSQIPDPISDHNACFLVKHLHPVSDHRTRHTHFQTKVVKSYTQFQAKTT